MPRFYCPAPLATDAVLDLPPGAARHVQVLRLQPGDSITLFNGGPGGGDFTRLGGEYEATITHMGRSDVQVKVGPHHAVEREAARAVHLLVGMPANDRMDWLVEKATELGVASIQPLMTERSVLRLSGERADKKVAHWQSVAIAACEQCGGNRVPLIQEVMTFAAWAKGTNPAASGLSLLLSLRPGTQGLHEATRILLGKREAAITFLSGPEGGLSSAEEDLALARGFAPVTLGPRVLRSETAALAALAALLVS
ncbi:16S rRNA (uracil(1498)-N(3))-methyltransferase [Rhodoferax sp.]|uniref:16S rRNA (uracil(1498)-N(3))-methyltransferase n=1 Tax=Rhodoferax sp. TaxID=50421 RepID=UPI001ED3ACB0|nr:16S rRNA (uracil(1498)-N(3))-methyltransferase [Rhodoferax sp.]MBT9505151.1 16S rRNA (uracil(1498)-N(3))-methyltransferase [Rhodoferax sp.]